jgi:hypothetical protein
LAATGGRKIIRHPFISKPTAADEFPQAAADGCREDK